VSSTTRNLLVPIDQSRSSARALMHHYLDEVVQALEGGLNRKEVWSQLRAEAAIHFRYETFCRLLRQLLRERRMTNPASPSVH